MPIIYSSCAKVGSANRVLLLTHEEFQLSLTARESIEPDLVVRWYSGRQERPKRIELFWYQTKESHRKVENYDRVRTKLDSYSSRSTYLVGGIECNSWESETEGSSLAVDIVLCFGAYKSKDRTVPRTTLTWN